jgi:hypothetical protein
MIKTAIAALGVILSAPPAAFAADPPLKLEQQFSPLVKGFGNKQRETVKILGGPAATKMLRGGSPGKVWQASLGTAKFKITIEDKLKLGVTETLDRLQRLPDAYRRALVIVSEGKKDGVAFYADLDGAAAHGSQDYLNLVRGADALVIAHESGHILEQRATAADPKTLENWKAAIAADKISVSDYGDQVAHEDLAEFAFVYAVCLDAGPRELAKLKRLSPRRFALWEKILKPDSRLPK